MNLIITITVLWVVSAIIMLVIPTDMQTKGQIGDMFGGINALFSGLALAGVIYAIILQKQDLKLQREELKLTREELQRTAKAQEKSERALREQVQSMEKTAMINGLSSILQYLGSSLITSMTGRTDVNLRDKIRQDAEEIKQKIEKAIKI